MRAAIFAAVLVAVVGGCGARGTTRATVPRVDEAESEISGVTVVARERAGSGHIAAGLFVRAPVDRPVLATAAALVLEERSDGRLVARATADGVAVRTTAAAAQLDDVVASLAAALASRDASPEEVARALARIRARRAGRADDDHARAARLAVAAAFGSELDALGTASDDEAITSEAVSAILRASFGVERALVAVVGDVPMRDVESAVEHAFSAAPHVAPPEPRAAELTRDVRVEVSEHDVVAVARRMDDLDAAERARGWIAWADPSATVSAFPLRGAAMILAVRDGTTDDAADLVARVRHARAMEERASVSVAPGVEGELLALGDGWLARGEVAGGDGLGVGIVVAGERDGVEGESDEAHAAAVRAASSALLAEPSIDGAGTLDDGGADQRLASGARVRVRRVGGGTIAVAIGFEGGSVLDPRTEHGRAALLGALLARSCEPDAEVTWTDPASIGIVVSGEAGSLERTVARAVDCVRRTGRETAHADGARAEAIALLDDGARARAWSAAAIAPATPGLVAPLGSSVGIAAASGLDAAITSMLALSRATFVVVGDVDPARAVAVTSALSGEISSSSATAREVRIGAAATNDVFITDPIVDAPEVIVTLRSDVGASSAAARATARALADALVSEGAAIQFWLGDAALGSSFVAVGVRGDDALLDALPTRLATRFASLDARSGLEEAVAAEQRRRALASPVEIARALASEEEPGDPLAVVTGLLAATPRYVMLRPSASPMRPPRRR